MKILKLYTPADDLEERVPPAFIRKVQQRLKERSESQDQVSWFCVKYSMFHLLNTTINFKKARGL